MSLVDKHGRPITTDFTKKPTPIVGQAFGAWAGRDMSYLRLPGGAVLQFDLDKLQLSDYRTMRPHYQINVSLFVMAAMLHRTSWYIECSDKKIGDQIELNLREVWTQVVRGAAQSHWAGFSPMVFDWENGSRYVELDAVRDLVPEDSRVNWRQIKGYAPPGGTPPTFNVFDGIRHLPSGQVIPPDNTLWYPLLMENGDYYGRKLLKAAFPSWFFSQLIHLFANRYFERYGEPTPIGRAPMDETVEDGNGKEVPAKAAMENILMNLRNRSVVVLPSDRDPLTKEFDYTLEYLESQLRGVDFERYLTRLDEEMSLALFAPILLFRTADVGSYNLGVTHMQLFKAMTNYLVADLAQYLQDFAVKRLHDFNWGPNAPTAYFRWRQSGKDTEAILNTMVEYTLRRGDAAPDLVQLGEAVGMDFHEVAQLAPDVVVPSQGLIPGGAGANNPGAGPPDKGGKPTDPKASFAHAREVLPLISDRLSKQVEKAWRENRFAPDAFDPELGYRNRFARSLLADGLDQAAADRIADKFYGQSKIVLADAIGIGQESYESPEDFMRVADTLLDACAEAMANA